MNIILQNNLRLIEGMWFNVKFQNTFVLRRLDANDKLLNRLSMQNCCYTDT